MRTPIVIILLLCSGRLPAQKNGRALADSLQQVLIHQADDTNKVRIYVQLTRVLDGIEPRKGFSFAFKGLALAEKLSWQKGIANINNSLGLLTGDTGNNTQARVYFAKSLAINQAIDAKTNMIANLSNIGRSYERESDFKQASVYYFQGLGLAEETGNDEQAALVGTNILSMYIEEKDYQKAKSYADSTIKWGMAAHALVHVAKAYEMTGVINLASKDTPAAKQDYDTAMAIYKRLGNQILVVAVLSNIATLEADPQKAVRITLEAQTILDSVAPLSQNSIMNLVNAGGNYMTLGESSKGADRNRFWKLSAKYLKRADSLSEVTKIITFEPDIQAMLASLSEDNGDYKTALVHYKRETVLNDSIFSQDSKNTIAKLESQRAIALKNQQIENGSLQISNQRKTMFMLVMGVALLGSIGIILWRLVVLRKRTNQELVRLNAELNEANKVKVKFLGILSHDLRSPIAKLLNFLQLQKKKPDSLSVAEKEEYWERLSDSARALLDTMEAMLLWSKGQMEVFAPRIVPVAVKELFDRLNRLFIDIPGVRFEFNGDDDIVVETDEDYLLTIMQNLTANAVRAVTGVEEARISWTTWREEGIVCCAVRDNGPGVREDQLHALYNDTVGAGARQGLGLHIIRDLAKAIGCTITVKTVAGTGSSFILSFRSRGIRTATD